MDPISDMLNSIRNAQAVKKDTVSIPFSNIKYEIAKILEKQEFIEKVEKKKRKSKRSLFSPSRRLSLKKFIVITLKYIDDNLPAISGLKRISKPGQRIYAKWRGIKKVKGGYGIAIISTSKGLMTDKEARKQKLGGEIICKIW